jgi:hypothetical protein
MRKEKKEVTKNFFIFPLKSEMGRLEAKTFWFFASKRNGKF